MAEIKAFQFVSLDGEDEKGIRAEVEVQVNKGTIHSIDEKLDKGTADVKFSVGNLKFPIHGWIRTDDEVYQEVIRAKETGEEVTFRIEAQRKDNVDRSIPIKELRTDLSAARDNTKVLLVAVNDKYTSEAVTNPNEDVTLSRGRYPAGNSTASKPSTGSSTNVSIDKEAILSRLKEAATDTRIRQPLLDNLASQAYLAGVPMEEIVDALYSADKRDNTQPSDTPRPGVASEAPSWKEYNSDGRLNLGSYLVAGALGVESLAYKQVHRIEGLNAPNKDETVTYFTNLIFAICDRIQVAGYGSEARVDRAANSHIRARGVVYDVIEKMYPLPISLSATGSIVVEGGNETVNSWITSVGKESKERFMRAIKSSTEFYRFSELTLPGSLTGGEVTATPDHSPSTPSSTEKEAPVSVKEKVIEEKVEEQKQIIATDAPKEDRVNAAKDLLNKTVNNSKKAVKKPLIPADEEDVAVASSDYPQGVLPPVLLDTNDSREKASDETISELQTLLAESGFDIQDKADMARISKLLAFTFGEGFSNARKVPNEELQNFIDHYVASGTEGLQSAIQIALGRD